MCIFNRDETCSHVTLLVLWNQPTLILNHVNMGCSREYSMKLAKTKEITRVCNCIKVNVYESNTLRQYFYPRENATWKYHCQLKPIAVFMKDG